MTWRGGCAERGGGVPYPQEAEEAEADQARAEAGRSQSRAGFLPASWEDDQDHEDGAEAEEAAEADAYEDDPPYHDPQEAEEEASEQGQAWEAQEHLTGRSAEWEGVADPVAVQTQAEAVQDQGAEDRGGAGQLPPPVPHS